MYYESYFLMENCTFILNHGQFGGTLEIIGFSNYFLTINITGCIFQANIASQLQTDLGVDYSQLGNFGGLMYGTQSYYYVSNSIVSEGYATKGVQIKYLI